MIIAFFEPVCCMFIMSITSLALILRMFFMEA